VKGIGVGFRHLCAMGILAVFSATDGDAEDFRVLPYLQHPTPDAISVLWFSDSDQPGVLELVSRDESLMSEVIHAESLAYPPWEVASFFADAPPVAPFRHRVRIDGLTPSTAYTYRVQQGESVFEGEFKSAPASTDTEPVRLIFFADSETEPESTGKRVDWPDPANLQQARLYLLDQTTGLMNNLQVILDRQPDLLGIAGDLVESGGEQRDWDEFWRHMTDVAGTNLAARVPLIVAAGNHEYYQGPKMSGYNQPGSERAISRWLSYFDNPSNGDERAEGRYYRLDYGPVTLISLDVSNGIPHQSADDTNYLLLGDGEAGGGYSPSFGEGSAQWTWLREQLADSQRNSAFTFVFFHHVPYSVGPHGWPAGNESGQDPQSGVPVRTLTPLFHEFGVDALIAGHDEMWERSVVEGDEILPDGSSRPHSLQIFDVGIAGDGLRGPEAGLDNPHQQYLVHEDAPETWSDGVLQSGGKHYGHLEIDILPMDGTWQAILKPVHVFPFVDADGVLTGFERRLYDDIVVLGDVATVIEETVIEGLTQKPAEGERRLLPPYPNPFNDTVLVRYQLARPETIRIEIRDSRGALVRTLQERALSPGLHTVEWNGRDTQGASAVSGVYLITLEAGDVRETVEAMLVR